MNTEEELVKTQTAFKKHMEECAGGFWGRVASKQMTEIKNLKRQIADLKKQVFNQWV